jgi:Raf kinase inhibitor-like YbhB/YbcL family protein
MPHVDGLSEGAVNNLLRIIVVGYGICCPGCGQDRQVEPGETAMKLDVKSTAFAEGASIPQKYTGDGDDVSPALKWSEPPPNTKSFAVICDDPDAPRGIWVHWVLFNVPGNQRELAEAVPSQEQLPSGAKQGTNDFGNVGYGGPAPPRGKPHRYFFKVYALDAALDLAPGVSKAQIVAAMKGHVLAEGQFMGKYAR